MAVPLVYIYIYIHELVVRARQLASVAQLVRALHRNHRATGSIPVRDLKLLLSQLLLAMSKGLFTLAIFAAILVAIFVF